MFESEKQREEILSQLKEVRDSGEVNMMHASGVQRVAYDRDLHALVTHMGSRPSKGYYELLDEFEDWLENNE